MGLRMILLETGCKTLLIHFKLDARADRFFFFDAGLLFFPFGKYRRSIEFDSLLQCSFLLPGFSYCSILIRLRIYWLQTGFGDRMTFFRILQCFTRQECVRKLLSGLAQYGPSKTECTPDLRQVFVVPVCHAHKYAEQHNSQTDTADQSGEILIECIS